MSISRPVVGAVTAEIRKSPIRNGCGSRRPLSGGHDCESILLSWWHCLCTPRPAPSRRN